MKTSGIRLILIAATALLLAGGRAQAASVTLVAGDVLAGSGSEVVVPVTAEGAQKMGALMMDLTYDPTILQAKEIEEFQDGDLAAGASVEANVIEPGRWRVALARSEPIEGKGALLRFRFQAIGTGRSSMAIEKAQAWDQSTPPLDMLVKLQPGSVVVAAAGRPLWLYGAIGAGAVMILLIVARVLRPKKQ